MSSCHGVTAQLISVEKRHARIDTQACQAYCSAMDAMELIETKKAATLKKVERLRTQLEAAELELRNLEITGETLTRLSINPAIDSAVPRGQSANYVLGVLGNSADEGKTPKEIYDGLVADGVTAISQDNVRTILSRHKDKFTSHEGRYWRLTPERNEPSIGHSVDGSQSALDAQAEETPEW